MKKTIKNHQHNVIARMHQGRGSQDALQRCPQVPAGQLVHVYYEHPMSSFMLLIAVQDICRL
jgi:hypothetical protein